MICGLVVLAPAAVRLLTMQTWDAELVPVAIAAMIVAIAYNPNFAMMVTFGLSLLDLRRAGDRPRPFPGHDGGDRGGRAHAQRSPHPHQADQGRRHGVAHLLPHDLGHRPLARSAAGPGAQRQLLARRLGPDGRLLPGRQPAVHRECPGDRHRHQPARAGRQHPSPAPGAGPARPGHAQPLDHRRRHRRVGRRTHRRRCPARAHRGLFPRHRQDAQAALLRREPGRARPTGTPSWRRR